MDKKTCENLIQAILEEKKIEDERKGIRQVERLIHRNKTVDKHNSMLDYQKSIGVKIHEIRQKTNSTQ